MSILNPLIGLLPDRYVLVPLEGPNALALTYIEIRSNISDAMARAASMKAEYPWCTEVVILMGVHGAS